MKQEAMMEGTLQQQMVAMQAVVAAFSEQILFFFHGICFLVRVEPQVCRRSSTRIQVGLGMFICIWTPQPWGRLQ